MVVFADVAIGILSFKLGLPSEMKQTKSFFLHVMLFRQMALYVIVIAVLASIRSFPPVKRIATRAFSSMPVTENTAARYDKE